MALAFAGAAPAGVGANSCRPNLKPYFAAAGIEVYHSDALEFLAAKPDNSFDLCLTDPPYGIDIARRGCVGKRRTATQFKASSWDAHRPERVHFEQLVRVSKTQIIWGGNYFADMLEATRCWLVWHKRPGNKTDFADCELAWTSMNANARVLLHEWNGFRKHMAKTLLQEALDMLSSQEKVQLFDLIGGRMTEVERGNILDLAAMLRLAPKLAFETH